MAGAIFALMGGLNAIGSIGAGILSDRFSRKNMLALVYFLRGSAYLILLLPPLLGIPILSGDLGIWLFAAIAGVSWIATNPLSVSLTADVYGLRALGTITGVSFLFHQVGAFFGVLLAGNPSVHDWLLYNTFFSSWRPIVPCRVIRVHYQRAPVLRALPGPARGCFRWRLRLEPLDAFSVGTTAPYRTSRPGPAGMDQGLPRPPYPPGPVDHSCSPGYSYSVNTCRDHRCLLVPAAPALEHGNFIPRGTG